MTAAALSARRVGHVLYWQPWLVTVVLSVAVLATGMRGPDLPAADLRAWLVREGGFTVWNDQWYGGHPTLGYSVLSPLIGAAIGVSVASALSCVAAAIAVTRICAGHDSRGVRIGVLWFCATIVTALVIGQAPFLLGVAFGSWAVLALFRDRPWLAALGAAGCSLASPLAGSFLILGGIAWASVNGWRKAAPLTAAGIGLALAFVAGGGGDFPMTIATAIPVALLCTLGLYLTPRSYTALRRGLVLYGLATVVLTIVPTPVGGNIGRLGALAAGPVTIAILLHLGRRIWMAFLTIPLLAWPACPALVAIANSGDDASRHASYYAGLNSFLEAHQRPYGRIEVPMTRERWEAAYVARVYPLARGWERQIDRRYNLLFYKDELQPRAYREWLDDNAVRYVALPDAPLDFAGDLEGDLLRENTPSWLRPVWDDEHWQVWEVKNAQPFASGAGELRGLGVDEFTLDHKFPGTTVVRLHYSRMWRSGDPGVCISRTAGGWLRITSAHDGDVQIKARPSFAAFAGPLLPNSETGAERCTK